MQMGGHIQAITHAAKPAEVYQIDRAQCQSAMIARTIRQIVMNALRKTGALDDSKADPGRTKAD